MKRLFSSLSLALHPLVHRFSLLSLRFLLLCAVRSNEFLSTLSLLNSPFSLSSSRPPTTSSSQQLPYIYSRSISIGKQRQQYNAATRGPSAVSHFNRDSEKGPEQNEQNIRRRESEYRKKRETREYKSNVCVCVEANLVSHAAASCQVRQSRASKRGPLHIKTPARSAAIIQLAPSGGHLNSIFMI